MIHRRVIRLFSAAALAALVLGCGDDDLPTDPEPSLEVSPLFRGIDEGESVQLTATLGGNPIAVTWESSNPARATVSPTGLVTGVNACAGAPPTPVCTSNLVAITATATTDATLRRSASITVIKLTGTALQKGVPVTLSSSGARGSGQLFRIFVPAGTTSLTFTLRGGTGDADIYVRRQTPPTNSSFTFFSFNAGNDEDIVVPSPQSGTWYVLVDLWDPYADAVLTANYSP
jgi:hypothetical protein